MTSYRTSFVYAAFAAGLVVLGTHAAMAQNVCTAIPTADGFVALRDGPSATARLIVQMRTGDMIVIDRHRDFPTGYMPVQSGQWLRASHYIGPTFPHPGTPEFSKVRRGWVHNRLVGECG